MATLNQILRCTLPVFLLISMAPGATAYEAEKNDATPNTEVVKRDFDTIRGYYSYDPATGEWSSIEDFKTVDIIENTTEQREDRYIYHSFWAYDAMAQQWYKVDIRDYGYKLETPVAKNEDSEDDDDANTSGFWKNWVLGVRGGGGLTFHNNKIGHLALVEVDRNFFLRSDIDASELARVTWPGRPVNTNNLMENVKGNASSQEVPANKKILFTGQGWNFPLTMFTHYTFFDRVRLGAGVELSFNRLKELRPREDAASLPPFKVQNGSELFTNTAWFGLLGVKLLHTPQLDLVLDMQFGQSYNVISLQRWFKKRKYVDKGWVAGAGVSYERKLNNYFKWLARIGADWKQYDGTPAKLQKIQKNAFVVLRQIAVHAELGIQVSFGEDTEEEELEAEEEDGSAPDSAEEQMENLKGTGRTIQKAKDQSDQLESTVRWMTR